MPSEGRTLMAHSRLTFKRIGPKKKGSTDLWSEARRHLTLVGVDKTHSNG